jgi:hypothetical protein
MYRDGSMESDTVSFDGTAESGLFDQMSGPLLQSLTHVSTNYGATNVPSEIAGYWTASVASLPQRRGC